MVDIQSAQQDFFVIERMKQHECLDNQLQHIIAITKQSKITT